MTVIQALGLATASAGGAALGIAARTLGAVRPAEKPLHPKGRVVMGRLVRHGVTDPTGVPFLDESGTDEVVVRESRALGLPARVPDIHGLAIRVTNPDGSAGDLLLASTGWGRLSRFVFMPSLTTYGQPMTTLLPYNAPGGPLWVGARGVGAQVVDLSVTIGRGTWRSFGRLTISGTDATDPPISFDPLVNQIPGLEQFSAVERLRAPAYRSARHSRDDSARGLGA